MSVAIWGLSRGPFSHERIEGNLGVIGVSVSTGVIWESFWESFGVDPQKRPSDRSWVVPEGLFFQGAQDMVLRHCPLDGARQMVPVRWL